MGIMGVDRPSMSRTAKSQQMMADSRSTIPRPSDLPEWSQPPLDEVAIAIQFKELSEFNSVHYGLFFSKIRAEFPGVEDRHRIQPKFETFGQRRVSSFDLEVGPAPPLRRVWLLSRDQHELLQLQPDRFIFNWRKRSGEGVYQRFDSIYPKFRRHLSEFQNFLKEENLGLLEINQCELSYFNNLSLTEDESFAEGLSRHFRIWRGAPHIHSASGLSVESESARFNLSFIVRLAAGSEAVGRVHVDATPSYNEEEKVKLLRLVIVFRSPLLTPTDGDALDQTMAVGRYAIVRTFDALGSDESHESWGRKVPT
jgi:uncharacterized protein (TIGR04255 family)